MDASPLLNAPTIVAPATAAAAGGVGIIRISGALAKEVAAPLVRGLPAEIEPRHAYFVELVDGAGGLLDQGLFLYFRAPHSFTGEDVVELHTHGSPRLLQLLVGELLRDGRARLAEPGEFSRRAFLNGRIDLARAEAIADLVSAESEAAVRAAAAQLSGALSERVRALKEPLFALRTDLEGVLNFPDEAEGADEGVVDRLVPLLEQARLLLADAGRGRLVRRGANVVLFGPVNAGKSTLFNRLIGEERALVDDEPGTTRDVLEARLELGGLTVALFDTVGLRERAGRIEALGIARAKEALAKADLAVLVVPPGTSAEEVARWRAEAAGAPVLVVEGKCDLTASDAREHSGGSATAIVDGAHRAGGSARDSTRKDDAAGVEARVAGRRVEARWLAGSERMAAGATTRNDEAVRAEVGPIRGGAARGEAHVQGVAARAGARRNEAVGAEAVRVEGAPVHAAAAGAEAQVRRGSEGIVFRGVAASDAPQGARPSDESGSRRPAGMEERDEAVTSGGSSGSAGTLQLGPTGTSAWHDAAAPDRWSGDGLRSRLGTGEVGRSAVLRVSGKTGEGIDLLREQVLARLWSEGTPGAVALVSERHADALRRAVESLERATEAAQVSTLEVVSGELGLALEALGEITGESAGAELLDAIFRRFCIGK